jgi:hypothetical protein
MQYEAIIPTNRSNASIQSPPKSRVPMTRKTDAQDGFHSPKMLRCIVLSAARSRPSIHITRPLLVPGFRFNSSQSSEERKALNKEKK